MRKFISALAVAGATCLAAAAAGFADPGPIQVSGQSATTSQQAVAGSSATQVAPSNTNIAIRVLSPGNDGAVSQSNSAASSAGAGNLSSTTQNADQAAAGGGGVQSSQQSAGTDQLAVALSAAAQLAPSNTNVPIRVLSPGNDGSVTQSNTAASSAGAGNGAATTQNADQSAGGSSCGCDSSGTPIQTSDQQASTDQGAAALSNATQIDPSNTAVSIRVLSPGNDGPVTQSNTAASSALAGNAASTTQNATQDAGSGDGIQAAGQDAATDQGALAASGAEQAGASNDASPVRVLSPGGAGSVSQSNTAASSAGAGNLAATTQNANQSAGGSSCGCGSSGTPIQTSDQQASTGQDAAAFSNATQIDPSNTATSIRVLSPGNDGSVTQSNTAASSALAGNAASTTQNGSQSQAAGECGCGGDGIQVSKQSAETGQGALALSGAAQLDPSNNASPVRVWSPGADGSVTQSNNAASSAGAGNAASTTQNGMQSDASGSGIQVAGQDAATEQGALAASGAFQAGASNDASPTRVLSPGGGGSVTQSNTAASSALAGNVAATTQNADQSNAGSSCGCGGLGIQALGQQAGTFQSAAALSGAIQLFGGDRSPCGCGGSSSGNNASPTRVLSPGGDGSVAQSNTAASSAIAGNGAATTQNGSQVEAGGGLQIQALGQQAETGQEALAASLAAQLDPSNDASPTRVLSPGGGGSVSQSNTAASAAGSANIARTTQTGLQSIAGTSCGCGSLPIQVAGQSAGTGQSAAGLSAALQAHPSNASLPVFVWSPSLGGSLAQWNAAASSGNAYNGALGVQEVEQAA